MNTVVSGSDAMTFHSAARRVGSLTLKPSVRSSALRRSARLLKASRCSARPLERVAPSLPSAASLPPPTLLSSICLTCPTDSATGQEEGLGERWEVGWEGREGRKEG